MIQLVAQKRIAILIFVKSWFRWSIEQHFLHLFFSFLFRQAAIGHFDQLNEVHKRIGTHTNVHCNHNNKHLILSVDLKVWSDCGENREGNFREKKKWKEKYFEWLQRRQNVKNHFHIIKMEDERGEKTEWRKTKNERVNPFIFVVDLLAVSPLIGNRRSCRWT